LCEDRTTEVWHPLLCLVDEASVSQGPLDFRREGMSASSQKRTLAAARFKNPGIV
jgi:hypothetical protein